MKTLIIYIFLVAFSSTSDQITDPVEIKVSVQIKGEETKEFIHINDLLGTWKNISTMTPILNSKVPTGWLELLNGNMVSIKDAWAEEYPNKLRNSRWKIVDKKLVISCAELGEVLVSVEKFKHSSTYDITISSYTYRRIINKSIPVKD
jgi:hypothetical protein